MFILSRLKEKDEKNKMKGMAVCNKKKEFFGSGGTECQE